MKVINKINKFFMKIIAKMLGFSFQLNDKTLEFTCKNNRGKKNLKKGLLKVIEKIEKDNEMSRM